MMDSDSLRMIVEMLLRLLPPCLIEACWEPNESIWTKRSKSHDLLQQTESEIGRSCFSGGMWLQQMLTMQCLLSQDRKTPPKYLQRIEKIGLRA